MTIDFKLLQNREAADTDHCTPETARFRYGPIYPLQLFPLLSPTPNVRLPKLEPLSKCQKASRSARFGVRRM